ncbi:MAG: PepSY-associated TM helix domain-containing protein [Methylomonas sp.]|nr:PepSY-associated TM helix domain-containing protein [Methylomonas sp.]
MAETIKRKPNLRQRWLAVHLYLGLVLGLVMAVTGLTGSVLVFYPELDEAMNPELLAADTGRQALSYETIYSALRRSEPDRARGWRLEIPDDPERMITARYYKPKETEPAHFAPLLVTVDPYSGEIVEKRFWGRFALTWLYDLHYTLLLDHTGKIVMAGEGLVLSISLFSGLYLWWPPRHKWRTALTIKTGASPERLNYDLHKVGGVYGFVVVLVLALTGVALEVPDYVNPLINAVSPLQAMPRPHSAPAGEGAGRITLDQAVAVARQRFPAARLCWIETPNDAAGSYRINLRQDFEPNRRFPKTNVWIDQYSGRVLAVNDPAKFGGGDILLGWLHALHSGEAFDLPGRWLVFFAGLICPLLFVTGVLRWMQKAGAKRQRRE